MPSYIGKERIGKGTPGEAQAGKDYQDQLIQLDADHANALAQHTPEGDELAGRLEVQKIELQKEHPFGSALNRPGTLGKIEHGLVKGLNIAGNIVAPETSSDMKDIQVGLAGDAVSEVNHDFEVGAFGTHIPLDRVNAILDSENMKSANQATRNFIVAYAGAKEAVTQLPRLQTFGQSSRMTEQQMKAAVKLLPAASDTPELAVQKIEALQRMIDPLRKQLPVMPGAALLPSFIENRKQTVQPAAQPTAKPTAAQPIPKPTVKGRYGISQNQGQWNAVTGRYEA